jgi:hypothetical protein
MDQSTENAASKISVTTKKHAGSCHCGAVRFEVEVDAGAGTQCNCSICTKLAVLGGIVKPEAFVLVSGSESLSEYAWASKTGTRFFCKHCGVHCFGRGHLAVLGGDYVSINFNSLDDIDPRDTVVVHWDGRHDNWQAGPRSTPWPISTPARGEQRELIDA